MAHFLFADGIGMTKKEYAMDDRRIKGCNCLVSKTKSKTGKPNESCYIIKGWNDSYVRLWHSKKLMS